MITIILGHTKCKIVNLKDSKVIKIFDSQMSYSIQGFQFMKFQNGWDGRQRLFTKNHYFPIGLLSRAEEILNDYGVEYQIIDNRPKINYGKPLEIDSNSGFKIRDYQRKAIEKAKEAKSGIIKLPTGSGKSLVIALLAGTFNIKTIIYVIGIELLYQMKETLERAYPQIKVGMVGDGHCDIQQITIMTIWSAANAFGKKVDIIDNDTTLYSKNKKLESIQDKANIRKAVQEAELFILDECQFSGSETVKLLHQESISARHRFLLSGTPFRSDGADILIEAVGGPKFFSLDASTLIDQEWLVPPHIYYLNVPSKRNIGKTYQEIYRNYISENDERNDIIVKATKELINKGRKVLILVSQVLHGKHLLNLLKNDIKVSSLDGKNSSEERMKTIQAMKNGEINCLIASKIFDQGVDIVVLDALILAGSGKSEARALQRIGRVIRPSPGKKNAIVLDFIDNVKYLKAHSEARQKIFKTEPRFKIILK